MPPIRSLAVIAVATLGLAGCFTSGTKEGTGTLVGAATGAVVGGAVSGNTDGAIVGAVAGGLIGNAVGARLDATDRRMAQEAEFRALEYGRVGAPVQWRGNSGHYGDVVAGAPYQVNDTSCRDYTHTIYINGAANVARGTACKQGEGAWRSIG